MILAALTRSWSWNHGPFGIKMDMPLRSELR
jgi:hypothetical protein